MSEIVPRGGHGKLLPEDLGLDMSNPEVRRAYEKAQTASEERRKLMSPPGELGLPPLLEARRLEYGVPDGAFAAQPIFDACCIWQMPSTGLAKIGSIFLPQNAEDGQKESASIGLLCGAGPLALDHLCVNGTELGHWVRFVKLSPYRSLIGYVNSKPEWLLEVRAVHIRASVDLRKSMLRREVIMVPVPNGAGYYQHHFKDREGKIWKPTMPRVDGSE